MADINKKLIVVLGPTASGKTKLAVKLAVKFKGEIISADSRQVYQGMDIGTGKDLADYVVKVKNKKHAPHHPSGARIDAGSKVKNLRIIYHLLDVVSPKAEFNVARYQRLAYAAIDDVLSRGQLPLLVGGTGLYLDAVIKGYAFNQVKSQKSKVKSIRKRLNRLNLTQLLVRLKKIDLATYNKIDKKNRRRVERALEIYYQTGQRKSETDKMSAPDYDILILGIYPVKSAKGGPSKTVFNGVGLPLAEIYSRIDSRLETRLKEGLIEEIKKLHRQGVSWKKMDEFGLEYRYVSRYIRGKITYEEMLTQLKNAIHHFAKRQLTWFKRNKDIIWINNYQEAEKLVRDFLA